MDPAGEAHNVNLYIEREFGGSRQSPHADQIKRAF